MVINPAKWIKIQVRKITQSIAFYPAIIAIAFLLLSWLMLEIDFSDPGKALKQRLSWLSLKDASTARTIISTVAGAIISLTVFSFSMVMIVLNQAASQMSNRVVSSMIENRFQQWVLGIYIGTIVYALFLLSTIRDINSGVYVPALSIYLLLLLTVIDIFLFIYFLDYVTQTVKYETVIRRVQKETTQAMKNRFGDVSHVLPKWEIIPHSQLHAPESNYFQGIDEKKMIAIAEEHKIMMHFIYKAGDFLIKGTPFVCVYSSKSSVSTICTDEILSAANFYKGQPVQIHPEYGFYQLAEIAIKALSPGINDPATAVISLHALTDLLFFRLEHHPSVVLCDTQSIPRIQVVSSNFEELFIKCIHPIWNYGKNDQYIQRELLTMLMQLEQADSSLKHQNLFRALAARISKS